MMDLTKKSDHTWTSEVSASSWPKLFISTMALTTFKWMAGEGNNQKSTSSTLEDDMSMDIPVEFV